MSRTPTLVVSFGEQPGTFERNASDLKFAKSCVVPCVVLVIVMSKHQTLGTRGRVGEVAGWKKLVAGWIFFLVEK